MSDRAAVDRRAIEPSATVSAANCRCFALSFGSTGVSTHYSAAIAASSGWRSPEPSPDSAGDLITLCEWANGR